MSYTNGLDKPELYFNTKLYTGNGSTQSITGVGFQPDFISIKRRSGTASSGAIFDVIRGATVQLSTNLTDGDDTRTDGLTSIDSDGFSLGADTGNYVNTNNETFVSWNWLAGGTGVSNTSGSITSTVSANTTSGFSIVSYTGNGSNSTIGHGLSSAPKMIIFKERNGTRNWRVYHNDMGNGKVMYLNTTSAEVSDTTAFNSTTPTSSVISVGTSGGTNASGSTYIAYCFAEKKGFSKFGSYTGNGNADGTFVYTGFKPAWVMIKRTDAIQQWGIMDNKRNTFNPMNAPLFAESSQAESSSAFNNFDITCNGIKMRTGDQWTNASGGSYIYMAFAEQPFVTSTGIPTTAR